MNNRRFQRKILNSNDYTPTKSIRRLMRFVCMHKKGLLRIRHVIGIRNKGYKSLGFERNPNSTDAINEMDCSMGRLDLWIVRRYSRRRQQNRVRLLAAKSTNRLNHSSSIKTNQGFESLKKLTQDLITYHVVRLRLGNAVRVLRECLG